MELIETKHSILKLIKEAEAQFAGTGKALLDIEDYVAEYLTANGVICPPCKVGTRHNNLTFIAVDDVNAIQVLPLNRNA